MVFQSFTCGEEGRRGHQGSKSLQSSDLWSAWTTGGRLGEPKLETVSAEIPMSSFAKGLNTEGFRLVQLRVGRSCGVCGMDLGSYLEHLRKKGLE